jgi:hypothetical protein
MVREEEVRYGKVVRRTWLRLETETHKRPAVQLSSEREERGSEQRNKYSSILSSPVNEDVYGW